MSCPLGGTYATVLTVGVSSGPGVTLCSLGGEEGHDKIAAKGEGAGLATRFSRIVAVVVAVLATVFSLLLLKKGKAARSVSQ